MSSGANRGFASHDRKVDFYFVTLPKNAPIISETLRDDVLLALRNNKMQVVSPANPPEGGYQIRYVGGPTEGTVTIRPVLPDDAIRRRTPLPTDHQGVKAEIQIQERWMKK